MNQINFQIVRDPSENMEYYFMKCKINLVPFDRGIWKERFYLGYGKYKAHETIDEICHTYSSKIEDLLEKKFLHAPFAEEPIMVSLINETGQQIYEKEYSNVGRFYDYVKFDVGRGRW